jgi:hypothetical protein
MMLMLGYIVHHIQMSKSNSTPLTREQLYLDHCNNPKFSISVILSMEFQSSPF